MSVRITFFLALGLVLAVTANAAETVLRFPAKVATLNGDVFHFEDLRHGLERGAFVALDGETEARLSWRDVKSVVFVGNIGEGLAGRGKKVRGTRRAEVTFVDGQTRFVHLVVGRIRGYDGRGERDLHPRRLSRIDFDTVRIAPKVYMVCEKGHVFENEHYRFCPYTGGPLTAHRVDQ
ncbi:MAG: hypothetical protein AAF533_08040 [Acidobacteriota bacterium]